MTLGVGTTSANSYPVTLEQLSGIRVVNAGVSGEVSDGGLKRLSGELKQSSADLLILIHGGNDILRNINPDKI
ncbi:MAG: hypothetical protein HRU23_00700 [Gammaproteobacteria bacterium]|nr:hypothetical protein [Gammaproteobacteria bacterium]